MNGNIHFEKVRKAIDHIRHEAEYGLKELSGLEAEGRTEDVAPEMRKVLEAIRDTATFDAMSEYHTLRQKLERGPVNEPDTSGPAQVNARFIVDWLWSDLRSLDQLVRTLRARSVGDGGSAGPNSMSLLAMLLESVGTEMLQALGALTDELQPLLEAKGKP